MSVAQIGDWARAYEEPQSGKPKGPFFHGLAHILLFFFCFFFFLLFCFWFIVLGFNDTSTLEGHFVSSILLLGFVVRVCNKTYIYIRNASNAILINTMLKLAYTVEPRYLELAYFELPLISKWKSGPCFNMKLWQQVTK